MAINESLELKNGNLIPLVIHSHSLCNAALKLLGILGDSVEAHLVRRVTLLHMRALYDPIAGVTSGHCTTYLNWR